MKFFSTKYSLSTPFIFIGINLLIFLHKPLSIGPDRAIHDPSVNRIIDSSYLLNDWIVNSYFNSGVHFFYGKWISFYNSLGLERYLWEDLTFILFLQLLIFSFISISKVFNQNFSFVFLIFLLHSLAFIAIPPQFGYGPYFPIDSGLSPRSLSVPLTFLAISMLFNKRYYMVALFAGLATLFHPSNGILTFILTFSAYILLNIFYRLELNFYKLKEISRFILVYLFSGGFFALYIALNGLGPPEMAIEKFTWSWIYLRAPYLDFLSQGFRTYLTWLGHLLIYAFFLYKFCKDKKKSKGELILLLIGGLSILFFLLFYFSFYFYSSKILFSLYSFRLIYLFFFSVHAMVAIWLISKFIELTLQFLNSKNKIISFIPSSIVTIFFLSICLYISDIKNLQSSISKFGKDKILLESTLDYMLFNTQEPVLMHPKLIYSTDYYIPSFVSFKTFGYTEKSMKEWLHRLDLLCNNSINDQYQAQLNKQKFSIPNIDWKKCFDPMLKEEVLKISQEYDIKYLLVRNEDQRFEDLEIASKNNNLKLLIIK